MTRKVVILFALAIFAVATFAQEAKPEQTTRKTAKSKTGTTKKPKVVPKSIPKDECDKLCPVTYAVAEFDVDAFIDGFQNGQPPKHDPMCISAAEEGSVFWYATKYDFRISGFQSGNNPFYVHTPFPKKHAKKVASGPAKVKPNANECLEYKANIETSDGKKHDPHIILKQ